MNQNIILSQTQFQVAKREKLLDYASYVAKADDLLVRIPRAKKRLSDPIWLADQDVGTLMMMTWGRAGYAIDLIALQYSAGAPIEELRALFVAALGYFEEYADFSARHNKELNVDDQVPHIPLGDSEFDKANRLVCFAILLGLESQLSRVAALIDYNCAVADGMLERLLAVYLEERSDTDECTRHLPYFKTLKIFQASSSERPNLMEDYLADWYKSSRREPYFESHKRADVFRGYWSWEAGAIAVALDIDDSSFRDAQFYPRDLVEFARSARVDYAPAGSSPVQVGELRAKAGDPCPIAGTWQSLDVTPKSQYYESAQPIDNLGSAYGLTVWRYVGS